MTFYFINGLERGIVNAIELSYANGILVAIGTNVLERWVKCMEIKKDCRTCL